METVKEMAAVAARLTGVSVDRHCLTNIVRCLHEYAAVLEFDLPGFRDEDEEFCWWSSLKGEEAIAAMMDLELQDEVR